MDCSGVIHDVERQVSNTLFYPECPLDLKPYKGRCFKTVEEGEVFYKEYGKMCGFNTRLGTLKRSKKCKTKVTRYVLCSKEGHIWVSPDDGENVESQKRRRGSSRVGCNALVKLRLKAGYGYEVVEFKEGHTHQLVSAPYRQLLRCNNDMDETHELMLSKCLKANIGPARSFRLFKELVGGYENIGCGPKDYKNLARDLRAEVSGYDAQMLLNTFRCKREHCPDFYFDYFVDDEKLLRRFFWADSKSRDNYRLFGDVVSFDATYGTNKHSLIFTPFTGLDNHGRCVTFGAGLLAKEDIASYSWMLTKFVDCMSIQPSILITDQDPALTIAIERVLTETRHRNCMWHIMLKVADKLPAELKKSEEFKNKLYPLVWNELIEPEAFELEWSAIMTNYGLKGHKWFESIFEQRRFWIPAFFRDFPMSGLLRTTSVSESENSFFKQYLNTHDNLIEFYNHFVIAVDAQRNSHDRLSMKDESCVPKVITQLPIEGHAAAVYTNKVFLDVQTEICASIKECVINSITNEGEFKIYIVEDVDKVTYKVGYNVNVHDVSCECKNFIRNGFLCRHAFLVLKNENMTTIPDKYILRRWSKFANLGGEVTAKTSGGRNIFTTAMRCIAIVEGYKELSAEMLSKFDEIFHSFAIRVNNLEQQNGKKTMVEKFYGTPIPTELEIRPPSPSKTKGTGIHRKKSNKEKAIELANRRTRKCRKCGENGYHDSRNCNSFTTKNKDV